jgi:hypothetical protein
VQRFCEECTCYAHSYSTLNSLIHCGQVTRLLSDVSLA